jgi:tetratricopeptide (TPR) repeat protein
VAYAALLQQHRREIHSRIVEVIESLHADRLAEHVDRLAYHSVRGELWDKAITYSREAAVRAATRSAYRESMTSFEEALRALGRLPDSPAAGAQAIDLRLDSRVVLAPLGEYDRILQYMQEAEVLARELGDRRRLGLVLADMGARLRNVGEHRRALEASRQALAIAGELREPDLEVEAKYRLAQAHFAVGDLGAATSMFEETAAAFAARVELAPASSSVARRQGALPGFFQAWPHAWLGLLLSHLGRFEQALQHAERAMQIAGRMNHPHTLMEAHAALGVVNLERGDLQAAKRVFEQGIALLRRGSARDVNLLSGLGYVQALSGRLAEALPLLEEAVKGGPSISAMGSGLAVRMSRLADAYLWTGRIEEALKHAGGAIELARKHHERANEAIALRGVAEITAATAATRAAGYYAEARALAEELRMRPLAAHCNMGLGRLYRRAAMRDEALEHLKAALGEYREMNMQFWPEQVEAEIRMLS